MIQICVECWNGTKYIFAHLELYTYAVVIQTYKHIYDMYIICIFHSMTEGLHFLAEIYDFREDPLIHCTSGEIEFGHG